MKNIVFSESPKNDIWLSLKNYTYPDNIKAYFDKQQISYDDELITSITGALIQAFEYFNSSKYVSLNTSPLLIYYGSINLFYGISCLLEGKKIRVEGHGMSIETSKPDSHNILETEIILMDKKHAGLKTYAKILNDEDIKYEKWNVQELLYSIPEISSFVSQDDLNLKYVIPSTLVWGEDETFHKISNIYEDKIKDVINFDKNYLPVGKNNKDELILRPRLNGLDLSSESYSGQKYFTLGHYKNKKLVQYNYFTYTFIALYGLATLGRYHTDIWTNFINNNSSSYIGLIEKFLEFCTRYLPNFALDKLTNKKNYYSNELFLNNQL